MSDLALPARPARRSEIGESSLIKWLLIAVAVLFLASILLLPLVVVFSEGLRKGAEVFFAAFTDPDTLAAVRLTLLVADGILVDRVYPVDAPERNAAAVLAHTGGSGG